MGTPDFAVPALDALVAANHDIVRVYTQPPRPAGRGQRATPSPVHSRAQDLGFDVHTPISLKPEAERQVFASLDLDAAVVVAYGLLLPPPILAIPRLGCLNIHASLLPRWRGAAPIQHAILAGDSETGVTIMQMDAGLDTGPILLQRKVPIGPATNATILHDRLAALGAAAIVEALEGLVAGILMSVAQPSQGATYARKLTRDDGRLDWSRPAIELERRVRALNPWPGAWFAFAGEHIRVLSAQALDETTTAPPGTLMPVFGLQVACGGGTALRLTRLQRAGKKAMSDEAFRRGMRTLRPGSLL